MLPQLPEPVRPPQRGAGGRLAFGRGRHRHRRRYRSGRSVGDSGHRAGRWRLAGPHGRRRSPGRPAPTKAAGRRRPSIRGPCPNRGGSMSARRSSSGSASIRPSPSGQPVPSTTAWSSPAPAGRKPPKRCGRWPGKAPPWPGPPPAGRPRGRPARVGDPFQGIAAHPGRASAHRPIGSVRGAGPIRGGPRRPVAGRSPGGGGPGAGARPAAPAHRPTRRGRDPAAGAGPGAGRPAHRRAGGGGPFGSVDALVEEIADPAPGPSRGRRGGFGSRGGSRGPGLPAGSDGAEPATRLPASPAGTPRPTGRAVCQPATRARPSGRTAVTTDHVVACRPWE